MSATLATVSRNAQSVVDLLDQARTWLATAVEMTGPEQIAATKAQIVTAATYARELRLSKEIQEDAAEMVRRAEYALAKAVRRGQEDGRIATRADNPGPRRDYERNGAPVRAGDRGNRENKVSPSEYLGEGKTRAELSALGTAEPEDFEAAITDARDEGNLSRANVVRKIQDQRDATPDPKPSAPRRRPLPDQARDAGWDLRKAVERLERIAADDRFDTNKDQMASLLRGHLVATVDSCQGLLDRINS